jgi:hypothetical protein
VGCIGFIGVVDRCCVLGVCVRLLAELVSFSLWYELGLSGVDSI